MINVHVVVVRNIRNAIYLIMMKKRKFAVNKFSNNGVIYENTNDMF